jgi:branched-chain amino acid transport system substrate-binding protein
MKHKTAIIGLAAAALVATACSSQSSGSTTSSSSADASPTTTASEAAGSSSTAPASPSASGSAGSASSAPAGDWAAGQTIKIGIIQPMTGPFAVLGTVVKNSMQVEVDKINSENRLGGAKLELVVRDMQLDPAKAVQYSNELAHDDDVKLVVGPSISAFYDAAKKTFEDTQMLNCQPAVASEDWASLNYGFQAQDRIENVVKGLLGYMKTQGITKMGMVEINDDGGRGYHDAFVKYGPDYGVQVVGWEQSRQDDQSHLAYVQKLMGEGAEAIWASNAGTGALTFAAAQQAGFTGNLITGNGLSSLPNIEATGPMLDHAVFVAGGFYWAVPDKASWPAGYQSWAQAAEASAGTDTGTKTGVTILRAIPQPADCVAAFAVAAETAQSFDRDKLARAFQQVTIPESESPSGCAIEPGAAHSLYTDSCTRVYAWRHNSTGWYTEDVTPN